MTITLTDHGVFLNNKFEVEQNGCGVAEEAKTRTMAYQILKAHNQADNMEHLKLKFDALVSPDNNYVNILQTTRASGMERFPVPYVLSNCHHTLCAVGGTINEDDHVYGLGNAKKYGGIFVPKYQAVLHQYMREEMAGCGKLILGSDSHTRYGALGTLGIGEGGGEVAKQLLGQTYDIDYPQVIAVKLTGAPKPGVGPMDVALTLIQATFQNHFSKNKILEFVGDGISNLSMEYRMGIDVMTTESAALSSIWCTDEKTKKYLEEHGRREAYQPLKPASGAYYDGLIEIDLSKVECMIALPFHPSNALPIRVLKERLEETLAHVEEEGAKIKGNQGKPFSLMDHIKDGEFYVDQALISGCSGGMFENIAAVADILKDCSTLECGMSFGVNPASLPIMEDLMNQGIASELAVCGVTMRPSICGPCFGVTDAPADNQISIRHVTRNYPNREGSKPSQGQMAAVCLMDARSIAATVRNGGRLTAATELDVNYRNVEHHFNKKIYENQVVNLFGKGNPDETVIMGPNIADWPKMYPLKRHLLLRVAGVYSGSVTTDELVPSGEASSFRSNPEKISEYMMISRDPEYVGRAKMIREEERMHRESNQVADEKLEKLLMVLSSEISDSDEEILVGSMMCSDQIGDGSSREQAASCQKVLGGFANLTNEYATKRYRSNLINWGILPLRTEQKITVKEGDYLWIRDVRERIGRGEEPFEAEIIRNTEDGMIRGELLLCTFDHLTEEEKQILQDGCLINYNRRGIA